MTRTAARRVVPPPPAPAAAGCRPAPGGERGFSFVEAMVALLISVEVIIAGLALFDFHNKLARVQAQVSDMQQSLRIAQYEMVHLTREAGRGGFPAVLQAGTINESWGAVAVRNNVTSTNDHIALGNSASPRIVDGTDVLSLRGVFSTPIYEINKAVASLVLTPTSSTPASATAGTLVVCATTSTQTPQDLSQLINVVKAAAQASQVEPLVLVGPSDSIYAVVELNTSTSNVTSNQPQCPSPTGVANPNGVLIGFNITGDATANSFQKLSATSSAAGLPPSMSSVAWLGVLEEYRYYVRQDYTVPGDTTSDPAPHLSRARMYPGTETAYYNDSTNLLVDVADNVLDLQVALGVDKVGDGLIYEGTLAPPNPAPSNTDDWIFNLAGDTQFPPTPQLPPPLREVRISTLVKTGRFDDRYQGPTITNIEDHTYTATDFPNTFRGRTYRHRLLQTVVGLRNL
jgi:Tfp pilus assembly protein PilW